MVTSISIYLFVLSWPAFQHEYWKEARGTPSKFFIDFTLNNVGWFLFMRYLVEMGLLGMSSDASWETRMTALIYNTVVGCLWTFAVERHLARKWELNSISN